MPSTASDASAAGSLLQLIGYAALLSTSSAPHRGAAAVAAGVLSAVVAAGIALVVWAAYRPRGRRRLIIACAYGLPRERVRISTDAGKDPDRRDLTGLPDGRFLYDSGRLLGFSAMPGEALGDYVLRVFKFADFIPPREPYDYLPPEKRPPRSEWPPGVG